MKKKRAREKSSSRKSCGKTEGDRQGAQGGEKGKVEKNKKGKSIDEKKEESGGRENSSSTKKKKSPRGAQVGDSESSRAKTKKGGT